MKHWEEAGLLTDLLDRHAGRLVDAIPAHDWSIFLAIGPFLRLIRTEPVLAALIDDCVEEVGAAYAQRDRYVARLLKQAEAIFHKHENDFVVVRETVDSGKRQGLGFDELPQRLERARACPEDLEKCEAVLDCMHYWAGCAYRSDEERWTHEGIADAHGAVDHLRRRLKQLALRSERFAASHPGEAYDRLVENAKLLNYAATSDALADEAQNREVDKVMGYIQEGNTFGDALGGNAQPAITSIQKDVRTLHLALVTSLAKGRSRWATVRRFAARCETFDRERLQSLLKKQGAQRSGKKAKARGDVEAILTMEFARYLFDAGFNPLVDVDACELRPDILDATASPAVYVEAKQYEKVSDAIVSRLKASVAQTVNTWARLAHKWDVPEAFLLVFRRSGRPIELDRYELNLGRGKLYVLPVDLADAKESGSRAQAPVHIDVAALLPKASRA